MSALTYTPTRHDALTNVAQGVVDRHAYVGLDPIWINHTNNVAYRTNDVRALNYLWDDGVIGYKETAPGEASSNAVVLAGDGREVLGEWDAEHPESLPDIGGPWRIQGSDAATRNVVIGNGKISLVLTLSGEWLAKAESDGDAGRIASALIARLNGGLE